jgi:hypothetical protein
VPSERTGMWPTPGSGAGIHIPSRIRIHNVRSHWDGLFWLELTDVTTVLTRQWEMTRWRELIDAAVSKGAPPILLHDCHNGCGSPFGGPTLAVAPCNFSDPAQQWSLPLGGVRGVSWPAGVVGVR